MNVSSCEAYVSKALCENVTAVTQFLQALHTETKNLITVEGESTRKCVLPLVNRVEELKKIIDETETCLSIVLQELSTLANNVTTVEQETETFDQDRCLEITRQYIDEVIKRIDTLSTAPTTIRLFSSVPCDTE